MAYITILDIRDEGITVEEAADLRVTKIITQEQARIDRICGQWFEERELTLKLDGEDSDTIHLSVPIIEVTSLKINGTESALDPDQYVVYDSRTIPDDRKNPRIKLKRERRRGMGETVWLGEIDSHRFAKGYRNQEVVGKFGYLESDDSTPEEIKYALKKLVIRKLKSMAEQSQSQPGGASLVRSGETIVAERVEARASGLSFCITVYTSERQRLARFDVRTCAL